jgi:hypothetical protein
MFSFRFVFVPRGMAAIGFNYMRILTKFNLIAYQLCEIMT